MHPIDPSRAPGPVTGLLQRWSEGDRAAMDRVIPLVYDELRRMAQRQLRQERDGHTLQSTGLVHEAFMKLAQQDGPVRWESRAHFLGWTATLMRHILVDHARARQAAKRGGGVAIESLDALMDDTQGQAAVAAQDEVGEKVAPAIAEREQDLREAVREVARSVRGEPGSDWTMRHRRWMSAAVKSAVIRRYGRRAYAALPW